MHRNAHTNRSCFSYTILFKDAVTEEEENLFSRSNSNTFASIQEELFKLFYLVHFCRNFHSFVESLSKSFNLVSTKQSFM